MHSGSSRFSARCAWYQRGCSRYSVRSSYTSPRRRRNLRSRARSDSRLALTSPSIFPGSPPQASHRSGSTDSSRSIESGCHDQRRLFTMVASLASSAGNVARTVSRRNAFTAGRVAPADHQQVRASVACLPRLRNSPYISSADARGMDSDQLRAIRDHYVAQVNWLVRRGRDDLIDVIADEYEHDLAAARGGPERRAAPDRAA